MKFKIHLLVALVIFLLLFPFFGFKFSLIITLFHFIPSIDYLMKKLNILPKLHRQLFHNVFVLIMAIIVAFYFTNTLVSTLGALNFFLHILMDLNGRGVLIFYPVSNYLLTNKIIGLLRRK